MAEPILLSAIIRALAEKKSTRKHAITPRYRASDIKIVGYELEMLINAMCRSSIRLLLKTVLPLREFDIEMAIELVAWLQCRNHRAYLSHWKKKMAEANLDDVSL